MLKRFSTLKVISHSRKVDENLLYLFLNKQIGGKYFKSNSISRMGSFHGFANNQTKPANNSSQINTPKRSTAMDTSKHLVDDEHCFSNINFKSLERELTDIDQRNLSLSNNWRESINTFYDYLIIKESSSFRKGCKISYDLSSSNGSEIMAGAKPGQANSKIGGKIVSSSQKMSQPSKTQISKSISVSSSVVPPPTSQK
jgi:hypothetical protein